MADVYLKYVGAKPVTVDSVSGTGTVWHGNGDIQPVPEEAAPRLLRHPDQWELVSLKEALRFEQLKPAEVTELLDEFDDGHAAVEPGLSSTPAKPKATAKPKAKA